jgi:hypothetical protein
VCAALKARYNDMEGHKCEFNKIRKQKIEPIEPKHKALTRQHLYDFYMKAEGNIVLQSIILFLYDSAGRIQDAEDLNCAPFIKEIERSKNE